MKKDIKDLEERLKKITGEDKLPRGEITETKQKKSFNSSVFTKLAEEVKRILEEDARNSHTAIKS